MCGMPCSLTSISSTSAFVEPFAGRARTRSIPPFLITFFSISRVAVREWGPEDEVSLLARVAATPFQEGLSLAAIAMLTLVEVAERGLHLLLGRTKGLLARHGR